MYQETFLKAAQKIEKIDLRNNPKNFLISIAIGIWKNKRKKYKNRQQIIPIQDTDDHLSALLVSTDEIGPEDFIISKEECELVRKATNSLKEKYQLVIYMYYSTEMSIEEISSTLHIPKGRVKSRLHKARNHIKQRLEDYGYER